jgi:UDP-N-acetylmuramate: L-alanyl-gamma-D-glutamyl-meso-diaminopimelate ligase
VQRTALIDAERSPGADWQARLLTPDASRFEVFARGRRAGEVRWSLTGHHNVQNALAAIAAGHHVGIESERAVEALHSFRNVKRRMEIHAEVGGITLYDDFAHHPTAIATTLEGLRARVGTARIIAILEPRSNTMRMGVHVDALAGSLQSADQAIIYQAQDLGWDATRVAEGSSGIRVITSIEGIVDHLGAEARAGDHLVFMSNGGFSGIHGKVAAQLSSRSGA